MAESNKKETVHGYEIQRSIIFENNRGFALAENPKAVQPFVTWMFTEENGKREYEWGHYCSSKEAATRDYMYRVEEYHKDYGQSEKDAYKYYSTQRPVDIATYPKTDNGPIRFVNFDNRESVERGHYRAWGYLVYDAPLTEKQISDYELKAAHDNPDVKERMREQAQVVGKYEQAHRVPDYNRLTWWYPDFGVFVVDQYVTPERLAERHEQVMDRLALAAEKRAAKKAAAEQELRPFNGDSELKKRMEAQAQVVGAWEEEMRLPDNERFTWHKPSIGAFALREPIVSPEQLETRYVRAKHELTQAMEKAAERKPIAERLKEGAEQAARDNAARTSPPKHKDKGAR